jgi:single-strand DNA-binding protein
MTTTTARGATGPRHRNEIVLVGEISLAPRERLLTSGEEVVTFRLDVARDDDSGTARDSFECTVHSTRLRRSAAAWQKGDALEVSGAVRRRFYRVGAASRPFVVVDVERARRLSSRSLKRRQMHG